MIRYIAVLTFGLLLAGVTLMLFVLPTPPQGPVDETSAGETADGNGPQGTLLQNVRLLGDFEAGLEAPRGFGWTGTDDSMVNGQSEVSIERVADPAADSTHALEIRSTVRPGFPYPWAGGAMMSSSGADISAYRTLRFDVRGTPGDYRLMAFNEGAMGIPPTVNFSVTDEWQTHDVPLGDLTGTNWRSFSGFAWVAGPVPGESTIYLDNVRLIK